MVMVAAQRDEKLAELATHELPRSAFGTRPRSAMTDDATPAVLPELARSVGPTRRPGVPVYPQPLTTPEPNAVALASFAVEDERGAPPPTC